MLGFLNCGRQICVLIFWIIIFSLAGLLFYSNIKCHLWNVDEDLGFINSDTTLTPTDHQGMKLESEIHLWLAEALSILTHF
uniref:Uncharacterized protein n=1 Tax=Pyxicephalus adspersus TaxID=30357 RepID=A0AAV3AL62_PYXAD|nr:TPA: hypothetical protein GDO54_010124 [Pyxicephalus adspersus]